MKRLRSEARTRRSPSIVVEVSDPNWRRVSATAIRKAAQRALVYAGKRSRGGLTVLLADDALLRALNARHRGKNRPTNVLSFPAEKSLGDYLGDVALAYGVSEKEARSQGKSLSDHAAHLAVHGILHLLGYDHEEPQDARVMEGMEIAILAKLGIANPYAHADRG